MDEEDLIDDKKMKEVYNDIDAKYGKELKKYGYVYDPYEISEKEGICIYSYEGHNIKFTGSTILVKHKGTGKVYHLEIGNLYCDVHSMERILKIIECCYSNPEKYWDRCEFYEVVYEYGKLFALNYLEELFKINNIDLELVDEEIPDDIKIYGHGKEYHVKTFNSDDDNDFSKLEKHFNEETDYLFLTYEINKKFYMAFLSKKEVEEIEKNFRKNEIVKFFEKDFLNELSKKLNINKKLNDLPDEEKNSIHKLEWGNAGEML